ncbi:MAG: alpha/beta hydrolase [bacterium]|nr:alpha/beta hydrolase [bacterium]
MPLFQRGNARIYYEDTGSGEPVIAIHGLIMNTTYWSRPGVAAALVKKYRLVSMDMRGHGKTVVHGDPQGFDVTTVGEDIEALAHYLGFDRFYLLSHSTGGFASVRLAMKKSKRIAGLILTNTGSATQFKKGDPEEARQFIDKFAAGFEKASWEQILAFSKVKPFPFFTGIAEAENNQPLWDMSLDIMKLNNGKTIGSFVRSFYTDPDPMIEGLRNIDCPVQIIIGDKDKLFFEASELMAREIPGAELIILEGIGHMSALEAPERVSGEILRFFSRNSF